MWGDDGAPGEASPLRDYLRVVARNKLVIFLPLIVVPVAAVLLSLMQPKVYAATAEVLLTHRNLAASLTGTPDANVFQEPGRIAETQARLARVPELARRALAAARLDGRQPHELLESSAVGVTENADILQFTVRDRDPRIATVLATAYAREFIAFRHELDTAALVRARQSVESQIQGLQAAGERDSRLYDELVSKQQQLQTMEALQTSNATLVVQARGAAQVQPRPVRNGGFGFALGLVVSFGLILLFAAFDTRVGSAQEIAARLGLPLLGRLPPPPRRLRKRSRPVMLYEPDGHGAEAFRMLRTNLDFVNLEQDARTIMVTSALEREGKSTTVVNLAIALAKSGRRTVVVDLDLRKPSLHRFFDTPFRPGLIDVAANRVPLEGAIAPLILSARDRDGADHAEGVGNGKHPSDGDVVLEILPAGPCPPDVGDFLESGAFAGILADLYDRADVVLFDSPPLLQAGETLALAGKVDGVVVVTHVDRARRPVIDEVRRLLARAPAAKLGVVLTGEDNLEVAYGYRPYYERTPTREEFVR